MKLTSILENQFLEKLTLKGGYIPFAKNCSKAYELLPAFDNNDSKSWEALKNSNLKLFKNLIAKTNVVYFSTESKYIGKKFTLFNHTYTVEDKGISYDSAEQMKDYYNKNNKTIYITADFSDHPYFNVIDNIIFRTVHDVIVHIGGNHSFGKEEGGEVTSVRGEIGSFNRHAKLATKDAIPALFTEVVGQVCYYAAHNDFGEQKIAILEGFDFVNVGNTIDGKYKYYDIVDGVVQEKNKDNAKLQSDNNTEK